MASTQANGLDQAALEGMAGLSTMMNDAAERGRATMEAGLNAWTDEAQRFYEELSRQGKEAVNQLKACQSPLEVLQVEQAWIAARSKAYMESSLRFAQACAGIAQGQLGKDVGATPPAKVPAAA